MLRKAQKYYTVLMLFFIVFLIFVSLLTLRISERMIKNSNSPGLSGELLLERNIFYVPGTVASVQQGIKKAKDGDMILVAPGRYRENINFMGKAIWIKSAGGPANTIIDGNKKGPTVIFNSREDTRSILEGFTVCNGSGMALPSDDITENFKSNGGGIFCVDSSPQIIANVITNNSAENGGGICCLNGASPLIKGNTIKDNRAAKGGGIRCSAGSSPRIAGNQIIGNKVSRLGGGIYWRLGSYPSIKNNVITGNYAGEKGGGLFGSSYVEQSPGQAEIIIAYCLIRKNVSPAGSSIALGSSPSKININNCNIEGGEDSVFDPEKVLIWADSNIDCEDNN